MLKKGFTLLEVLISISLFFVIIFMLFSLLNFSIETQRKYLYEKELIEVADDLKRKIEFELSDTIQISEVLDSEGILHTNISDEEIDIVCFKMIKNPKSYGKNNYIEKIIFYKTFEQDSRRSVWIYKNSSKYRTINTKLYYNYRSYEIGTHLYKIYIKKTIDEIYSFRLIFKYYDKDVFYEKQFLVKLNNY